MELYVVQSNKMHKIVQNDFSNDFTGPESEKMCSWEKKCKSSSSSSSRILLVQY